MNHIKNSIEAKASIIQFEGELRNGKLHLFIIDNGHGIKDKHDHIIPPSKFEKIFDPYYSTKDGDNCERNNIILKWLCDFTDYLDSIVKFSETKKNIKQIRGIGTYLNRTTLRNNGGDLRVIETTSDGTVFEIITSAKTKT
jgi:sensor histidine kinase regulating citrate/malate metabolism